MNLSSLIKHQTKTYIPSNLILIYTSNNLVYLINLLIDCKNYYYLIYFCNYTLYIFVTSL
ncbi:hypothetical protein BPA_0900014 (plasmid) [Borrelia parkeri SLO]|uniref:Uncharacterized protein n=1 Tax=Borrelia parkeri SLO TaxID=1313294 RepID=W5SY44_BORPR|nr:hypothetical protein BPA_0900014 [Borrelia parkeri SLO]